jgi:hypothetical protein
MYNSNPNKKQMIAGEKVDERVSLDFLVLDSGADFACFFAMGNGYFASKRAR